MEQAAMQRKQMDKGKKLILWTGYSGQPADYQRPALFLVLAGRRKGEKSSRIHPGSMRKRDKNRN